MAKRLILYKALPIVNGGEDIPAFRTAGGRLTAFQRYAVLDEDERAFAFYKDQGVLIVDSVNDDIADANYAYVAQDDGSELFYFVNDVNAIERPNNAETPSAYRLALTIDEWQTEFFKKAADGSLSLPKIVNAVETETTRTGNDYTCEYVVAPPRNITETFAATSDTANGYLLVFCQTNENRGAIVLAESMSASAVGSQTAAKLFGATKLKIGDSAEYNITPTKAYYVPAAFFVGETLPLSNCTVRGDFLDVSSYASAHFVATQYDNERAFALSPSSSIAPPIAFATGFEIGTLFSRVGVKNIKIADSYVQYAATGVYNPFQVKTRLTISSTGLVASFEHGGTSVNVTRDFELPVIYSPSAQFFAQNGISTAIKGVGSLGAVAGGLFAGNPLAIAAGAISAAGTAATLYEQTTQPYTTTGTGDGVANAIAGGFCLWVKWSNDNRADGECRRWRNAAEKYGFKRVKYYTDYADELVKIAGYDTTEGAETFSWRKFERLRVVGRFGQDHAAFFENALRSGVRFYKWE